MEGEEEVVVGGEGVDVGYACSYGLVEEMEINLEKGNAEDDWHGEMMTEGVRAMI